MVQLDARPGCTVVAGNSGTGKTEFILRYLVARRDFTCRFAIEPPKKDIALRCRLSCAETLDELELGVENGWCIFDPPLMFPGDRVAALEWFAKWSYDRATRLPGRKILYVDEAWRYTNPHKLPQALGEWVLDGRGLDMETIFGLQEPNKLNSAILNEKTEAVCFRVQSELALQEVRAWGLDRSEVSNLPPGHFVARNCERGGFLRGRVF